MKALLDAIADSLCSNQILNLVKQVFEENAARVLKAFVRELLRLVHEDGAQQFLEGDVVGQKVAAAFRDAECGCKCLAVLMQVETQCSATEQDVLYILNYNGRQTFLKVLKSLIASPEPAVQGVAPDLVRVKVRDLLNSWVKEIVSGYSWPC